MRCLRYGLFVCFLLSGLRTTLGQDSLHVSRIATLFDYWSNPRGSTIVDTLVYLATGGSGLRIVSIADPDNLYEVGYYDAYYDGSQDVAIVGSYAFVVEEEGFRVFDISDPFHPTQAAYCPSGGFAITTAGNYAYVSSGGFGMRIIDISNPTAPTEVCFYDSCEARDIEVRGGYAYLAGYGDGLRILDVSNPAAPFQVGVLDTNAWLPGAIEVAGNYAYLACYTTGLQVVDISNPVVPVDVGNFFYGEDFLDIEIAGSYIYLAEEREGIYAFDISNPADPQYTDRILLPYGAKWLGLGGNLISSTDGYSLRITNITDPHNLVAEGMLDRRGGVWDVAVQGDYAFAINGKLQIIDISNPGSPAVAAVYEYSVPIWPVEIAGDRAYLGGREDLVIVNISNPTTPWMEGSYNATWNDQIYDIAVSGDFAYLAAGGYGLEIYNVADPLDIYLYGVWQGSSIEMPITFVTVEGNYAYVVDNNSRLLHIIDVSGYPVQVNDPWTGIVGAKALDVVGNYAYVGTAGSGFKVLDVSDPSQPVEVGTYSTNAEFSDVKVIGNYAYAAAGYLGLLVFDITDPAHPAEVGYHRSSGAADKLAVWGCNAYLAEGDYFSTFDISYFAPCPVPREPESLVIQYVSGPPRIQLNWLPVVLDTSGLPISVNRYVVYHSPDLSSAQWDSLGEPSPPDTTVFIHSNPTDSLLYYRVKAMVE